MPLRELLDELLTSLETGPLITAAIRLGSSTVTDGDCSGAPSWQPRSDANALVNTDAAIGPPRAVSPRQCRICASNCHWPSGCATVARATTAPARGSCGIGRAPHSSSNRNRGPLPAPVVVNGATLTQAPRKVVWTAGAGVQIAPGAFQEFSIVAGPMPAAGTAVLLPAIQTYSDGTTVHWDQVAKDGAAEPEFPAPKLVAPVAEESASDVAAPSPGASSSTGPTIAAEATGSGAPSADPVARSLGGLALILAATGLGLVVARRRTPQVKP